MPSACDEDRDWARSEFGTIDSGPISGWLEDQGYKLTPQWQWIKPAHVPTPKEMKALSFLIDEWDYGGWAP